MYSSEKDESCVMMAPTCPENMVLIPAGKFEMGSGDTESVEEQVAYTVHVDAFDMDAYAVTNLEYQ